MSRQFLIVGHDAPTHAEFSLDDLPGAGRIDVLCRCVTSAFLLSHDIREDVRVALVLDDTYTLTFDGESLKGLNPDERSTGALIRNALADREDAIGQMAVETSPGVSIDRRGFEAVLADIADGSTVLQLHENGQPAVDTALPGDPVFILSDHRDFTRAQRETIAAHAAEKVSLGPRRLHSDQAVTVAHNWLDTGGYQQW